MKNNSYLFFICTVAIFGGLLFGFDVGVISGAIPFIQPYFGWSELALGWGAGSILLGAIFGAFGSGMVSDRFGRKKVMIVVAILFALSCLGMALAGSSSGFIMARILAGLAVGAVSVLSPMYVAEVAPAKIRGTLLAIYQLAITFGIVLAYLINYAVHDAENNWRLMFGVGVLPSSLFLAGLFFIPESPRWLVMKGKPMQALKILERTGRKSHAGTSLKEIEESLSGTKQKSGFAALTHPSYRKMMIVGFLLAVFVQISGVNTVVDYAPKILMAAGLEIENALLQTSLIGMVFFGFTFFAVWLIDKLGRRTLYIWGSAGMAITLTLVALTFFLEKAGMMTTIFIMAFIAFFAACIGPAFWTIVAEMFPNKIRASAVAFASFTQWIFNFLIVMFFPYFLDRLGGAFTFIFLAAMSGLQLLVAVIFLPETKGKTLEEIEIMWRKQ